MSFVYCSQQVNHLNEMYRQKHAYGRNNNHILLCLMSKLSINIFLLLQTTWGTKYEEKKLEIRCNNDPQTHFISFHFSFIYLLRLSERERKKRRITSCFTIWRNWMLIVVITDRFELVHHHRFFGANHF